VTDAPSSLLTYSGEGDQLTKWIERFIADAAANNGCPPNSVSGDSLLDVCRAYVALRSSPSPALAEGMERAARILEARRAMFLDRGDARGAAMAATVEEDISAIRAAAKETGNG